MNEQTKEKWDNWEKIISVALGVIGVLAILFKYFKSGYDWNELLDATVNLSQVAIPVLVVIVTHRALMKKKPDFYKMLEAAIQTWAKQNQCLIEERIEKEGEKNIRAFYMLTKNQHRNFVTQEMSASDIPDKDGQLYNKGKFLDIANLTDNVLVFRLNKSLFIKKAGDVLDFSLEKTAKELVEGIIRHSGQALKLTENDFLIKEEGRKITISLGKLDKSEEEVELIVSMLEYMKTAILAMA